jgi:hypothetical protein
MNIIAMSPAAGECTLGLLGRLRPVRQVRER